jgi:bacillithiol biosynthesis cysteine-adding enzyme BshC
MTDLLDIDLIEAGLMPSLASAFVEGRDLDLLAPLGFVGAAAEVPPPVAAPDRRELAAALAIANAGYGHAAAETMTAKLADPATRVVVTGQQPGLFGGPLYTLSKAVAAALWVERLEASGQPAVAVFWVATEDHDFREVARATFFGRQGPESFALGDDPEPLTPVGMRSFGSVLEELLERLRQAGGGDRWQSWIETLAGWYRPDARFGEAFSRLLAHLLGERCPLLMDAMLPAVKAAQRPWLRRVVESRQEIELAFAERNQAITARGHGLQVTPRPGTSPLFVIHGRARRRVEWRGTDRFTLRGEEGFEEDVAWLLEAIEDNPSVVSPGVMARSAMQDAILGSSVLVLGPGEVSYMPQVAPIYERLGIAAPMVHSRPQALVQGSREVAKLGSLDLRLGELVAVDLDLDRALAGGREEDLAAPIRDQMKIALAELRSAALALDGSLEGPWKKTSDQVERALASFTGKVAAAVSRRNEVARARAEDLRATCRPQGALQERVIATAHFPGKHGDRLVDAFFDQLTLDSRRLHIIRP